MTNASEIAENWACTRASAIGKAWTKEPRFEKVSLPVTKSLRRYCSHRPASVYSGESIKC